MPSELCFFTFGMFAAAVVGLLVRARPRPADDRACPVCGGTGVLPDGTHVEPVPADSPTRRPRSRSRRTKVGIWVPPSPEVAPAGDLFLDGSKATAATATAEHPHLPKLRALVRFGLAAARADGRIAASEKKVIRAFLTETFGHEPALLRQIDPLIERAEVEPEPEADAVAAVVAVVPSGERAGVLRFADRVLDATGKRTAKKSKFHHRAAAAFGVADSPPTPPVPAPAIPAPVAADPRAVLEIDPGTELAPDLIRRKFALLSEKLAAGKATAMGSDFARLAAEKRAALRTAAEALIAPFGVPLDPPAAPPPPADIRHNPDLDDIFGG